MGKATVHRTESIWDAVVQLSRAMSRRDRVVMRAALIESHAETESFNVGGQSRGAWKKRRRSACSEA